MDTKENPNNFLIIEYIVIATCILSILGSSFIIISFILSKELRISIPRRLLFFLSLSDFGISFSYLLYRGTENTVACKMQSVLNIYSNQSSFFWTDFLALYLFLCYKYEIFLANKFLPLFYIISGIFPLISCILVISFKAWGPDDGQATAFWCWIDKDVTNPILWRLIAGKFVEWFSCIFIFIVYIFVFKELKKQIEKSPATQLLLSQKIAWKKTEIKIIIIPAVFILLRLPGTIRTIYAWCVPSSQGLTQWEWLAILQGIGDSGQGFTNGMIFGIFTPKVNEKLSSLFHKCCFFSSSSKIQSSEIDDLDINNEFLK